MVGVTVPEWLTRHGGDVQLGSDGKTRFVMLNGTPEYTLVPRPVAGKFGCFIKQTNSGHPIASARTAATEPEAVVEGLEDLRQYLGW